MSRILGFIRDSVIAFYFPKSLTDPFYAAIRIPNTLRQLLAEGALSAAYVPTFTETLERQGEKEADRLVRSLFLVLFGIVLAIVALGMYFTPVLVRTITSGYFQEGADPGKGQLTIELTRMMFPYLMFVSLAAIFMGSLHSLGHFTMPALSPIVLNICIISSIVAGSFFIRGDQLIYWAAGGFVLGGLFQMLIQYPPLFKRGFLRGFPKPLFHPKLGVIGKLVLPATFGQGITQINVFVNLYFASQLVEGSITYLYFAMRMIQFPLGMFGIAVATVSFPRFARLALADDKKPLNDAVRQSNKMNLFLVFPSALGLIALGKPIVGLLFDHGQFHRDGSLLPTYDVMLHYMLGLLAYSSLKIIVSVYYSFKDMITPIIVGIIAVICNIILNYHLSRLMSYNGLALGTALASLINVGLLSLIVRKHIGKNWWQGLPGFGIRTLFASCVMAMLIIPLQNWMPFPEHRKLSYGLVVALGVPLGAGIYFGLCWLLIRGEMKRILERIFNRFMRGKKTEKR